MTKSSLLIWHYVVSVKWTVNISSIFLAFLENTNLKKLAKPQSKFFEPPSEMTSIHCACPDTFLAGRINIFSLHLALYVPHLRLIYILIIWPKLYSTFMTHQSVKQNDATQWVQRFYEVAFECFFKFKKSANFKRYRYLHKIAPKKYAPHSLWQSWV